MKRRAVWMGSCVVGLVFVATMAGLSAWGLWRPERTPDPDADYRAVRLSLARVIEACQSADFERVYLLNTHWTRRQLSVAEYERSMRQRVNRIAVSKRVEIGAVRVEGDYAMVEVYLVGFRDEVTLAFVTFAREAGEWWLESVRIDHEELSRSTLPRLRV